MYKEIQLNGKYTIVFNIGSTVRYEIIVTGWDAAKSQYIMKHKGKRTKFYLQHRFFREALIFEGHDLPFVLDNDIPLVVYSHNINFITDDPKALKEYIEANCINLDNNNSAKKICYAVTNGKSMEDLIESLLFPESILN